MADLYTRMTHLRPSGWRWLPECGAWTQTIVSTLPEPTAEQIAAERQQRQAAAALARERASARDRAIQLCDSDCSADELQCHMNNMAELGLAGVYEYRLAEAALERKRDPEAFANYVRVMPDFIGLHYQAGGPAARAALVAEARQRIIAAANE